MIIPQLKPQLRSVILEKLETIKFLFVTNINHKK